MKLSQDQVASVVSEASTRMSEPNYSATLVGDFVGQQAPATQFISAHEHEVGGAEGVVSVVFHAALVAACFSRATGRPSPMLSFDDLDRAAKKDPMQALKSKQLPLHEFIAANIENEVAQKLIAHLALAFDDVF